MCQKLPFKILYSSDSVVAQKKFIFIFVRIIISLEKNPRKPVSKLREEIGDFKLLKHIKLLVTYSTLSVGKIFRKLPQNILIVIRQ